MSILNGTYAHGTLLPEPQPFGEPFDITGEIQLENALDADTLDTGKEKLLVSAGRGNLMIHRLGENGVPVLVSELGGLGDSRQISVSEGFAYVTARADGLYICDLRNPEKPALAGRIDTLELATGVCAADGVLAVTNRHMGCELWDVREPYSPGWLGSFCCGEAQSVRLHKNLALIGDWMNRYVRIFDISDPQRYLSSRSTASRTASRSLRPKTKSTLSEEPSVSPRPDTTPRDSKTAVNSTNIPS